MSPKWKPEDMPQRTALTKCRISGYIRIVDDYRNDTRKKERKASRACKVCYYVPRIGGHAMTESECHCCGKTFWNSSTAVDKLCKECADKYKACVRCGGKR